MPIIMDRLRLAFSKSGMTYAEFEKKVNGISKATLQRYVSGTSGKIPMDALEQMAYALNVSPAYLMGWRDEEDAFTPAPSLTPEEARVLAAYRAAEATYRKVALELLETHPASTPARQTLA